MNQKYFHRVLFVLELHVKIATLSLPASGYPNQSLFVPQYLNWTESHKGHMSLCQQGANVPFHLETRPYSLKTRGLHWAHQNLLVKFIDTIKFIDQVYWHHLKRFQEHLVLSICPRILNQGYMWLLDLHHCPNIVHRILRSIWPFCTKSFRDSSKDTIQYEQVNIWE